MSLTSPVSCVSNDFSLYCILFIYLPEFLSFDESDSFDDESNNDGSDSGSAGTRASPFCFDYSVGRVGDSVGCVEESVGRVSGMGLAFFYRQESNQLAKFFCWSCSYQKELSSKVVDS